MKQKTIGFIMQKLFFLKKTCININKSDVSHETSD